MSTFHPLTVKKVIKETSTAVSIEFSIPTELKANFVFKAGQYITLKKEINNTEVRRAYSICVAPDSEQVKVAVKAVENGTFSVFATTQLKEGDVLEVAEPEGKFILEPQSDKHYIGFAAGSGITPIMSMIKTVLTKESSATFTLVYGNKTADSVIFKSELETLANTYPTQFKLHYVFSQTSEEGALFGRIDKGNTNYLVKNVYKHITFDAAFLCGPEQMIDIVSETLQENIIAKENIHFELFTSSTEENEVTISEGKTEVTVLLDDEETSFVMDNKDTLLAASLRNNLDAPYSCQGGVCSSCMAKVTSGNAVMIKNSILTDDELEEGYILTCQAHPTTPKITLDFDDV